MNKVSDIFDVVTAKSKSIEDYSEGSVPFISNGFYNNGIISLVEPFDSDRVINELAICVSAFCEATVQKPPFIGRGNGGSGITILIPKNKKIKYSDLIGYASFINTNIKWRFSYGRMVTKGRISDEIIQDFKYDKKFTLEKLKEKLPKQNMNEMINPTDLSFHSFLLTDLFDLQHGDFHSLAAIDEGIYPTVSRIDNNNGIVGYYDKIEEANIYPSKIITVSTVTGDSFVQLDPFISTDNVVLLTPKKELKTETLFYISLMINREKWRWMYGRQCYKTKFATTKIMIPSKSEKEIDEKLISEIFEKHWGWNMIKDYVEKHIA